MKSAPIYLQKTHVCSALGPFLRLIFPQLVLYRPFQCYKHDTYSKRHDFVFIISLIRILRLERIEDYRQDGHFEHARMLILMASQRLLMLTSSTASHPHASCSRDL